MKKLIRWTDKELALVDQYWHLGAKRLRAMMPHRNQRSIENLLGRRAPRRSKPWGARKGEHDDLAAWRVRTPCA